MRKPFGAKARYDFMRSIKNLSKRASAYKNQSRNKKLSHRHSFSNPPINTKQRRKIRLQQPYVHTQLAIAMIVKNPDSKKQKKRQKIRAKNNEHLYTNSASKPYVRTQLAIATIINTTKVLTTNSKAHSSKQMKLASYRCCLLYTSPSPRDS